MNVTEIQSRADALVKAMLGKAMRQPSVTVMIKSLAQPSVFVEWKSRKEAKYSDNAFDNFSADTIAEAFDKADAWVAARLDPEQAKLNEFMAAVGAAADLGRELGIDAEFVNPLLVTMKSLSENALTYQGAAE